MNNIATINRIIPFSNVDGYGNRMAIFFQSCPLKCLFCHNPETINMCINCFECVKKCPTKALTIIDNKVAYDKTKCVECDTCLKVCPNLSSPRTAQMSVDELYEQIYNQKDFIRGITVSGGECMNHAAFLLALFKKVKENTSLTCLIDSNGYYNFKDYEELMNLCDGVMLDVKIVDKKLHQKITGADNEQILKNLEYLLSINKLSEVRCIMYPNLKDENLETIDYVCKKLNNQSTLKLIAFRPFGVREEGFEFFPRYSTSKEEMDFYKEYALKLNQDNLIII